MEIDHVFVCCAPGAPEGDALLRAGLAEGSGNVHPSQGTANRRFFFANAYLELLWVHDAAEARSPATRATRLWERWQGRGTTASPFGVLLRPDTLDTQTPFPTWPYRPGYLPRGMAIEFAHGVPLEEPEIAVLPRTGATTPSVRNPRQLVGIRFGQPHTTDLSAAARALHATGAVTYFDAGEHVLELAFDGDPGVVRDLRPGLPLVLRGL